MSTPIAPPDVHSPFRPKLITTLSYRLDGNMLIATNCGSERIPAPQLTKGLDCRIDLDSG